MMPTCTSTEYKYCIVQLLSRSCPSTWMYTDRVPALQTGIRWPVVVVLVPHLETLLAVTSLFVSDCE